MKILLYSDKLNLIDFDEIVLPCEGVELVLTEGYPDITPILSLIEYCIKKQIGLTIQDEYAMRIFTIVELEDDGE